VVGIEFLWQVLPFAKLPQPICVNLDPLTRSGEDQVVAASKVFEKMCCDRVRCGWAVFIFIAGKVTAKLKLQFSLAAICFDQLDSVCGVRAKIGVALPLNLRHDAFGDIFCP